MDKAFVKVQKSRSYFKRYQTKFRRRREGKTNYHKRRKMVVQDKTEFNTPKYRFIVRISNKQVICQVVWSKMIGDEVVVSATSKDLIRYGMKVGLKNYSATYCTGFLCGRRLLSKVGLGDKYESVDEISGEQYLVDPEQEIEGSKPFTCYFDTGLHRSTVGAKIFAALKGACDAGVYIPHKVKKFPGYNTKTKEYNAEKHRDRILGQHVADYMKVLKEKNEEEYKKKFSQYIKHNIQPENIPKMVEGVIEGIKKDPNRPKKAEKDYPSNKKWAAYKKKKLPLKVRMQKRQFKIKKLVAKRNYLDSIQED